jgi:type VI secretion system protein ImpA
VSSTPLSAPPLPALEPLLAPISLDSPAGEWLRFDPLFDEIKLLREADDPALPQGVWQRELKRSDWSGVAGLCCGALATRTKDLQLAAWLAEAWIRLHGFRGLERGARLLAGLCEGFWECLHPPLGDGNDENDDGQEARLAPLLWVVDRLPLAVKSIPVTAPTGEDSAAYGWIDWESGLYLANLSRLDGAAATKAQDRGMVPQDRFLVSVSLTPAPWLTGMAGEVAAALAALDALDRVLTARCGDDAPSLSSLRTPLAAVHAFVSKVLDERGEPLRSAAEAGADGVVRDDPARPARPARPEGAGVLSRSEAYQRLSEAADFLLRTEPHSPVPYLVRRAVSWGNLSLAELLQELLQKNADLPTLYTLLGIKRTS